MVGGYDGEDDIMPLTDEQFRIWANDIIGMLTINELLRLDVSHDDVERVLMDELKHVVGESRDFE